VATILVLGSITGLVAVRQAVLSELTEFANAVMALNQSFSFTGQSNCQAITAGSAAVDLTDGTVANGTFSNFIPLRSVGAIGSLINQPPCD
jgi:hypothetical protein